MRNLILIIAFLVLFISCDEQDSPNIKKETDLIENEVSKETLEKFGIDSLQLKQLTSKIEKQEYPNIHSVIILKNSKLVYEQYFSGNDQSYGKDIGIIHHNKTTLHDLRSVSKSVVSICVGIAIDKGMIKGVQQKISDFFPEIELKNEKANWTIEHFLTMTTGLDWNEKIPYTNPKNDEIQMTYSKNPIAYVLNKPLKNTPGVKFNYSGGATQILAEIIERVSNTSLDKFANDHLFLPLGIKKFEWKKFSVWGGANKFAAPSGLRLTSRDLLKIGLLYQNNGKWRDKQVLSEEWIKQSFSPKIGVPVSNSAYGYQFWMWSDVILKNKIKIVRANGNGGQNIFWDLKNDLIVVTTAGNYNKWNIKNNPYALLRNEIYPLFLKKK